MTLFIHIRAREEERDNTSEQGEVATGISLPQSRPDTINKAHRFAVYLIILNGLYLPTSVVTFERAIGIENNHTLWLFSAILTGLIFVEYHIFRLFETR